MKDVIDTIEYKGYKIKVEYDQDALSPREWDNIGTMVCFHSRYTLGDKHDFRNREAWQEWYMEHKKEIAVILPLFLYDHSGLRMSTSTAGMVDVAWDVSMVGYIYVTKEKVRKEYGRNGKKKAEKYLRGEVEVYDNFLSGSVYGYVIENPDGDEDDSCSGFYGYDHKASGLLEQAQNSIDCTISAKIKEHTAKLKAQIKNHVPLQFRKPLTI